MDTCTLFCYFEKALKDYNHANEYVMRGEGGDIYLQWQRLEIRRYRQYRNLRKALIKRPQDENELAQKEARIRELEKAAKDHVEYVQQNSGCPTTIEEVRRGAYLFEQLEKALSEKSNQSDKEK